MLNSDLAEGVPAQHYLRHCMSRSAFGYYRDEYLELTIGPLKVWFMALRHLGPWRTRLGKVRCRFDNEEVSSVVPKLSNIKERTKVFGELASALGSCRHARSLLYKAERIRNIESMIKFNIGSCQLAGVGLRLYVERRSTGLWTT